MRARQKGGMGVDQALLREWLGKQCRFKVQGLGGTVCGVLLGVRDGAAVVRTRNMGLLMVDADKICAVFGVAPDARPADY
jgi:hypothetical protein